MRRLNHGYTATVRRQRHRDQEYAGPWAAQRAERECAALTTLAGRVGGGAPRIHTLHRLEYAGLVERVLKPEDGRSPYVALTPRGVEVTDTVAPLHLDNERRLLAGLTPDEQRTLAHLLRKLLLGFEHDQPAPAPRQARRPTWRQQPRQR
jgi:hypothetical protein